MRVIQSSNILIRSSSFMNVNSPSTRNDKKTTSILWKISESIIKPRAQQRVTFSTARASTSSSLAPQSALTSAHLITAANCRLNAQFPRRGKKRAMLNGRLTALIWWGSAQTVWHRRVMSQSRDSVGRHPHDAGRPGGRDRGSRNPRIKAPARATRYVPPTSCPVIASDKTIGAAA